MGQIKVLDRLGNVAWFLGIQRTRFAFSNGAEPAMAGADIARKHERGGAVRPTLKDVGASCLLTYGVQIEAFDQLKDVVLVCGIANPNLQPVRLGLAGLVAYDF